MHCWNWAVCAICMFKDHFLAILAGIDSTFPPYLWDLLLPQAELTLNLLHQAMLNPGISACKFFQGPFDFNKTPLDPVSCCILIHAKPATRQSWDFHMKPDLYIGPTLDSYHCFKLVKSNTKSQVILDTIKIFTRTSPPLCLPWKIRSHTACKLLQVLIGVHHLPQASPNWKLLPRFKKSLNLGACLLLHPYGQTTALLLQVQE
jgi:hypothetical protein